MKADVPAVEAPAPLAVAAPLGPERYPAAVWRRFCAPRFAAGAELPAEAGAADAGWICGSAEARAQQARVLFLLRRGQGGVIAARFRARGCPTTIAVADFVAERLTAEGRPPAVDTVAQALEIAADRRHCILLCEDAVRAALSALTAAGGGAGDEPVPPPPGQSL